MIVSCRLAQKSNRNWSFLLKIEKSIKRMRTKNFTFLPFYIFAFATQVVSILHKPNSSISDSKFAFCNYYITKLKYFNVHIDCDAQYFLLDSQNPMRIINDQSPIQDRPLHAFIVYVITKFLELFGIPASPISYSGEDGIPQTYNLLNYGVYILLNLVILFISVQLVLKVLLPKRTTQEVYLKVVALTALLLVVQNAILREFFWTPHSQLFNILIPCLIFYLAQPEFVITKKILIKLLPILSLSLLIYPIFFIVLPIVFIKTYRTMGKFPTLLAVFVVIPKLIWPFILGLFGGHYNDTPVSGHRRFIWILDAIKSDTLLSSFNQNAQLFFRSLPGLWVVIVIVLTCIGFVNLVILQSFKNKLRQTYFRDSIIALIIYWLGIALNGEYGPRFTTGLVILFGLIILNEVTNLKLIQKFWWLPYALILAANLYYWISN